MFKKKPTPTIASVSEAPAVREAAEKVEVLRAREAGLVRRIDEISTTEALTDRDDAIRAVLDGADPADATRNAPSQSARQQLQRELDVVRGALKLAIDAHAEAKAKEQTVVLAAFAPRHAELSKAMASALLSVSAVQLAFLDFEREVRDAGASWPSSRGALGVAELGEPLDPNSLIAKWLALAAFHGFVTEAEMPPEMLDSCGIIRDFLALREGRIGAGSAAALKLARFPSEVGMPSGRVRSLARLTSRSPRTMAR